MMLEAHDGYVDRLSLSAAKANRFYMILQTLCQRTQCLSILWG